MTETEKEEAVSESMPALVDLREMKALSVRTVPVHAFHDIRKTMEGLTKEVSHGVVNLT